MFYDQELKLAVQLIIRAFVCNKNKIFSILKLQYALNLPQWTTIILIISEYRFICPLQNTKVKIGKVNSTSDVNFRTSLGTYSITENNIITVTPDLPCSMNGATLMIYSITAYQANPVPSWVSVGSSTGSLTISAPNVTADTVF